MKILFWVPYPTQGPSNRYRVEQYLPYLKEAGIDYALRPFWSVSAFSVLYKEGHFFKKCLFFILGTIRRLLDVGQLYKYDIVFIHREAYPVGGMFLEAVLALVKKPVIFDFDDAIFLPSSSRMNSFIERFKRPDKIAKIIRMSSYCIAGNKYLADFASKFNPRTCIIPTPIDTQRYRPAEGGTPEKKVVIGWIGSVTTVDFLDQIRDVIAGLSRRFSGVAFKIVGSSFSVAGLSDVTSKPWAMEEELNDLRSFDIGIMPVPDNPWTRGKCGFKAILYMSMGIPTVCSPIGVNKEIITDGVNGFLAATPQEWMDKFSVLIENRKLRERIGRAGRRTVEERFSLQENAPKFLKIISEVYNGAK